MTEEEIRAGVVRIFEASRQAPGAPFDEDRFLAFLTTRPASRGMRHADTFAGCRRFWRFMKAVQFEFGVCFTNEEWDRGFSLTDFVTVVQAKMQDPTRGKRLAAKRLREDLVVRKDRTVIWSLMALLPLAVLTYFVGVWGRAIFGLVWIGAVAGIYYYHARQVSYARRLIDRIERSGG